MNGDRQKQEGGINKIDCNPNLKYRTIGLEQQYINLADEAGTRA